MKRSTFSRFTFSFYITAVRFCNLAANGETDSRTMKALARMKAFEHFKYTLGVGLVKANSIVDDADAMIFNFIVARFKAGFDLNTRQHAVFLEFYGVIKQVVK